MFNMFKTIGLSAMIGLGALTAMPASAQADGLYLNLGNNGDTRFGVYVGDRDARHYRGDRDRRYGRDRATCTPRRALNKAERLGLRRVAIRNVNHRAITVAGRDRGDRVLVTFGRYGNCPIIRR